MDMPTMESVDKFKAAMDSDRGALGPFMTVSYTHLTLPTIA